MTDSQKSTGRRNSALLTLEWVGIVGIAGGLIAIIAAVAAGRDAGYYSTGPDPVGMIIGGALISVGVLFLLGYFIAAAVRFRD